MAPMKVLLFGLEGAHAVRYHEHLTCAGMVVVRSGIEKGKDFDPPEGIVTDVRHSERIPRGLAGLPTAVGHKDHWCFASDPSQRFEIDQIGPLLRVMMSQCRTLRHREQVSVDVAAAAGVLAAQHRLTRQSAVHRMRAHARNTHCKMSVVAREVLDAHELSIAIAAERYSSAEPLLKTKVAEK